MSLFGYFLTLKLLICRINCLMHVNKCAVTVKTVQNRILPDSDVTPIICYKNIKKKDD